MKKYNYNLGKIGETIAEKYFKQKSFIIIEKNFYTKWGEVDIIAKKNDILHFIEVKTRTNLNYGQPEAAVTKYKYKRTKRAVLIYLNKNHLANNLYQIDALGILYNPQINQAKIRFFPNIYF